MIPRLILLCFLALVWVIYRQDAKTRNGVSAAVWIPTLWVTIIATRPLSMWLGAGGGSDSLEGSPLDRLFYFVLIAAAFYVISKRQLNWPFLISRNWAIFLFYGFLLISVAWAEYPLVSFKRWFKEFGNIIVVMVILTEADPAQAIRALFVRNAFLLIPLSYIFIRWFPDIGRRYNVHSGGMEAIGVTNQKNDLGAVIFVCGIICLWDLLEGIRVNGRTRSRLRNLLLAGLISFGAYLMKMCDSKTSLVCLVLSAAVLLLSGLPIFQRRPGALGVLILVTLAGAGLADSMFGIREAVLQELGRDMTFTGRTDVWRELLNLHTDPIIGTGFCSFWSNKHYLSLLPDWVAHSAHNGYLEIYLDGGWLGIFFLGIMLLGVAVSLARRLLAGANYAIVSFAVFLAVLVDNFSESYFAKMSPIGFLFLLGSIDYVHAPSEQLANELAAATASEDCELPLDALSS
jgi:O-antigen ligase